MNRFPNKLPNIDISTTMGCKLDCKYCPQQLLISKYTELENSHIRKLKLEDFKICLDKVYEKGTVTFSGMAEPFQNREASLMMKYAYETGRAVQLFTTLIDFTEEDLEIIKNIKFSIIVLHIPDEEGNSKFKITQEYLNILKRFIDNFNILYYSCHGTVHHKVLPIINKDTVVISEIVGRAGNLKEEILETYDWKGKIVCTGGIPVKDGAAVGFTHGSAIGFTHVLLPNGTLTACSIDYGLELVIGNLIKDSWEKIVNSKMYSKLELAFEDDTIPILCRKCHKACHKEDAINRGSNFISNHAIKIGRALELIKNEKELKFNCLDGKIKETSIELMKRLVNSKNVCVFGLGKLFNDNYFKTPWNFAIQANIFSDNNQELWGKEIEGILCIEPSKLVEIEDLLIVIYVNDDKVICKQLDELGLKNYFNIYEIYNIFD